MDLFDLHLHSVYSDGFLTPEELAAKCEEYGLAGAALTDHDSIDGWEEFSRAGNLITIPGVEIISCHQGNEIHILGYGVDPEHPLLKATLTKIVESRQERARKILRCLQKAGVELTWEEIVPYAGRRFVGRVHIYRAMKEKGIIGEDPEKAAFRYFLSPGGVAYVPHREFPTLEIISLVRQAGGCPVWAHPGRVDNNRALLEDLVDRGLEGIEVFYPAHPPPVVAELTMLAEKYGLIMTGGSDYHGWPNENPPRPGAAAVEEKYIKELLADYAVGYKG